MNIKGKFILKHFRKGKLIGTHETPNLITNEGLNSMLDVAFGGAAQNGTWYFGLIDNAAFSAVAVGDTAAKITGTENAPTTNAWQVDINYSEANRIEWVDDAASGQSKTNSAAASFSVNAGVTIKGAFLVSSNVKSGTAGVLWSAAAFGTAITAIAGDSIEVTYVLSAS